MQEQIEKVNTNMIGKKRVKLIKKWSLTFFAAGLLISSLFVISTFAETNVKTSTILTLTNKERAEAEISALSESKILNQAAYNKAQDMFKYQYFEHTSPQGKTPWEFITKAGYDYAYAGENLAMDFESIEATNEAWMNSPSHKANILNPKYSEMGSASVTGTFNGETTTITVEMFGTSAFDTALNSLHNIW